VKYVTSHLRSACAIGSVSFFILFLAASQPHRVHHLFENLYAPAKVPGLGTNMTPTMHSTSIIEITTTGITGIATIISMTIITSRTMMAERLK
jgi:hypothetical protein